MSFCWSSIFFEIARSLTCRDSCFPRGGGGGTKTVEAEAGSEEERDSGDVCITVTLGDAAIDAAVGEASAMMPESSYSVVAIYICVCISC